MGKIRKVKSYKILLEMSVLSRQVPTDLTQLFFDVQVCSPMKWRRTSRSVLAVSPVIFFALSRSRGRSCCRGQAASNWKLAVDLASRIKGTWGDLTQQGTICLDSFGRCWKSLWPIYGHLWSSMIIYDHLWCCEWRRSPGVVAATTAIDACASNSCWESVRLSRVETWRIRVHHTHISHCIVMHCVYLISSHFILSESDLYV